MSRSPNGMLEQFEKVAELLGKTDGNLVVLRTRLLNEGYYAAGDYISDALALFRHVVQDVAQAHLKTD